MLRTATLTPPGPVHTAVTDVARKADPEITCKALLNHARPAVTDVALTPVPDVALISV